MKILYFKKENQLVPGILTPNGVIDVNQELAHNESEFIGRPIDLNDLEKFKEIESKGSNLNSNLLKEEDLTIGSCVPYPPKIICVGLNYLNHAKESGMEPPKVPVLFTKYNNTLTDYGSDIPLGKEGVEFDYEVELGVVIGKSCKNVTEEDALNYVLGYCTANDLSCRDLQFKTPQWLLGKSLDHFLPLGRNLVTTDEVGDVQNLKLSCTLNGDLRQNSNTSDMIFSVAEIISFISKHMTLVPGDLILTGTPEGVIMGLPEKNWLKPNDVVKVEIEKLGITVNKMI